MLKIGITGGIGSGKTTVCELFRLLQIPVFNADLSAKNIMEHHPFVRENLTTRLGAGIYTDGILNRKLLARIIFTHPEHLSMVNQLVHPLVQDDFREWVNHQTASYILMEAAILFESETYKLLDGVILVSAPEKLRIDRVIKRDHLQAEEIKRRIANQCSEEERMQKSDYVIVNDDKQALIPQVLKLDAILRLKHSELTVV